MELPKDFGIQKTAGLTDADEIPEPPKQPTSKTGDVWILGNHRLICGDSTKAEVVSAVMVGEKAALILADPPYFEKVEEEWDQDFDGFADFLEFLGRVFDRWSPLMLDRGTSAWWCAPDFAWHIEGELRKRFAVFNHVVWYKGKSLGTTVSVEDMRRWRPRSERLLLCEKLHSPDALLASFNAKTSHIAARSAYATIIDRMIAWREASGLSPKEIDKALGKNGMAGHYFGRSQWMLPHEEAWGILRKLFSTKGVDIGDYSAQRAEFDAQRREFDAQRREFDAQLRENLTDVWEIPAPHGKERFGHPTPKPVAMYEKIVSAHSRPQDIVADPFSGTAPTLMACEITGRKCRAIELAPEYVDVALKRWQEFTGKEAVLEETGHSFAQTKEIRRAE
jgi:adenine-specific DNA-methyltransferase